MSVNPIRHVLINILQGEGGEGGEELQSVFHRGFLQYDKCVIITEISEIRILSRTTNLHPLI